MSARYASWGCDVTVSVKSILILAVCIVAANLLLVALRTVVDIPFSDGLQSAIASGIVALAWVLFLPRLKR